MNNWRALIGVATGIVAISGAIAVLQPYVPWAPRDTVQYVSDNTIDRLSTKLIALKTQYQITKKPEEKARLEVLIRRTEKQIDNAIERKKKYK